MNKLRSIIIGWKGVLFENSEQQLMAVERAQECAKCDKAEWGLVASLVDDDIKDIKGLKCSLCKCPLSAKLRSPEEKCDLGKWGAK